LEALPGSPESGILVLIRRAQLVPAEERTLRLGRSVINSQRQHRCSMEWNWLQAADCVTGLKNAWGQEAPDRPALEPESPMRDRKPEWQASVRYRTLLIYVNVARLDLCCKCPVFLMFQRSRRCDMGARGFAPSSSIICERRPRCCTKSLRATRKCRSNGSRGA